MNDIATLIYKDTILENGLPKAKITQEEVFCAVNSLSHEEQTQLSSYGFRGIIKNCVINNEHDNINLVEVIIDDVKYTIRSKDHFKNSDQISLLLEKRVEQNEVATDET